MALHWRPVGPEPAPTYWRRRAVVVALALLLLLLLRALLGGGDDAERLEQEPVAAPTTGPTPSASAGPSADPSAGPWTSADPSSSAGPSGGPVPSAGASGVPTALPCADGALQVEAAAEQAAYPVGASPRLELRITNAGPMACSRDLGQAAVELLVFSGADRIWSSDDCAPGGGADLTALEPGAVEVSRVTWSGTRSLPGCAGSKARAVAGTYRVTARIGALRVEGEPFLLR